jgi:DNA-binding HxlR family transcriptional regulator
VRPTEAAVNAPQGAGGPRSGWYPRSMASAAKAQKRTSRTSKEIPGGERCSIARSLSVLGERWTLLILRELFYGKARYGELQDALGIPTDILSDRLATLVDAEVIEKRPYRDAGSRRRFSYHLTQRGEELKLVLGALQQWGDRNLPHEEGPSALRTNTRSGRPLQVAFVENGDCAVPLPDVTIACPPEP